MKVEEPPPIQPTRQIGIERAVPPADEAGGSRDDRRSSDGDRDAQHELHDIAAVHGVETEDLTPNIRSAMVGLIAEVAELREELHQNRKRLEYMTTLADQDSISLVLNRRAFVRELSRALVIAQRRGTDSSLLFVEIENLKAINERHGLDAGDAAIEHIAALIQGQMPEGEIVGRVGGAEFGIILIGEQEDQARERAEALIAAAAAQPLVWESAETPLSLIWGAFFLSGFDDAGAAMVAADRRMRTGDRHMPADAGDMST